MAFSIEGWSKSNLRQTFLVQPFSLGIKALRNSFQIITFRTKVRSTITPSSIPRQPYPTDSPSVDTTHTKATMAPSSTSTLESTLHQLQSRPPPSNTTSLLTTAKHELLTLNALIPSPTTPPHILSLARTTLEQGALCSIRLQDPTAFTKYFDQLSPFYALPAEAYQPKGGGERAKIMGLYLLLLLTRGDYAGFHVVLEGLEMENGANGGGADQEGGERKNGTGGGGKGEGEGQRRGGLEEDKYIGYPVRLERWLMEGSYDRVWKATKGGVGVPGEEEAVFSEVLVGTIRAEIASCSEKAYPSLPIANAKNLLFLESEGSVVEFAKERGWVVREGRIYFPDLEGLNEEKEVLVASRQVTENAIGYARELETIV